MAKKVEDFNLKEFLVNQAERIEKVGFLEEAYTSSIKNKIMRGYRKGFIQQYYLDKIIPDGDRTILKWEKRMFPLTPEQLKEFYNPKE